MIVLESHSAGCLTSGAAALGLGSGPDGTLLLILEMLAVALTSLTGTVDFSLLTEFERGLSLAGFIFFYLVWEPISGGFRRLVLKSN